MQKNSNIFQSTINNTQNNKRIAKNTLLLYVRMLVLMLITLYTSRIILNTLGVEDYGIYNVVGGFVLMFSVISGSLSNAVSRFITIEVGKKNEARLQLLFSSSVTILIVLSLIIVIVAETIGLWFLCTKMVIPVERQYAAMWVYQMAILTFCVNLISVPYNSVIIAHEKISAFAYITIVESVLKLAIAFLIAQSPIDKLVFYSILMCIMAFVIRVIYGKYCKNHFKEAVYKFIYDRETLRKLSGFAGWSFIGAISSVLRDQGGNVLINLFCGPAVNAARGISVQVNTALNGFVSNFMTALNPPIIKAYAQNDQEYMIKLAFNGARYSFFLLLFLSLPVIFNTHYFLSLWLNIVPEHTVTFVRLILILALSDSIAGPFITIMMATGKIKKYQIIVGGLNILNLPASYCLLKLGYQPEAVFITAIVISQLLIVVRIFLLKEMVKLNVSDFFKKVYLNAVSVSLLTCMPLFFMVSSDENISASIINTLLCFVLTLIVVAFVGATKEERILVWKKVRKAR